MSRYSLNMKKIMPELKTSILHFTKLNKEDHSPVTYRPEVIEKPTEWQITVIYQLSGLFLFEIGFI